MRLVWPVFLVLLGLAAAPAPAAAASVQDLLMLRSVGVSDDILVALIESDGSLFRLSAADIVSLRQQGLSEQVIKAMLATRRGAPEGGAPSVRVVERRSEPVVRVEQRTTVVVVPSRRVEPPKRAEPVYWGFGGQRRPDTWEDTGARP